MRTLAGLALLLPLAAHAADVTVVRPMPFIGAETTYYVLLDGQLARDIEAREHVRFSVAAGRHVLAVRCPKPLYGTYAETRSELDLGAADAFFAIEPKYDCVTISALDARAAAPLLRNTRLRPADKPSTYTEGKVEGGPLADGRPAQPALKEDVGAATAAWVEAFNSRDPARIVALYDPEAVLIGATAQKPVAGTAAIAAYYRDAPSRPMSRVALGEHAVQLYGEIAIDSGLYNLFQVEEGKATVTPARFTLVYRRRDGKWLIVEHHSSRVP